VTVTSSLHIVWDWNGTLLDDLEIVVESLNVGTAEFGVAPIDEDGYRDHFKRPVRAFYDSLFGRMVSDMEWAYLNKTFHDEYNERVHRAPLTVGAVEAVERASSLGWSQSLLSMSIHGQLLDAVISRGIADRFTLIDGLTVPTGGLKSEHLETHLDSLGRDPRGVLLIGDTPDDAVAARQVGAGVILFDGGSHHLPALKAMGAPVAHTLGETIDLALSVAKGGTLAGIG
jgi:phosphoglycolate phosphatase-like HAD superfamily hydrolase